MRLIDADALREEVLYDNTFENDTVNYYLGVIDDQPTIDAEPVRHGKWMEKRETSKFHVRYFECSECRAASYRYQTRMNYCPNCGAKMDREG